MILSALVLTAAVAAAPPDRLFVTAVRGDDEALCATLERAIVEEAGARGFDAMSSTEVVHLVDVETQRQLAGCEDESCLAEIADGLGARMTVTSSLARVGARYVLSLSLLDTLKAKVTARERAEADSPEQLLDETRRAAARLLGGEPTTSEPTTSGPSVPLAVTGGVVAVAGVITSVLGLIPLQGVAGAESAAQAAAAEWVASGRASALEDLEAARADHFAAAEQWNTLGMILVAAGTTAVLVGGTLTAVAFVE